MTTSHPTREELLHLAEGRLAEPKASDVRIHLTICESCRQAYAEVGKIPQETIGTVVPSETRRVGVRSTGPGTSSLIPGYRMLREIHRGGQGVVYEAYQESTRRTVALKVMLGGPFAGEASRQRFRREVELAAGLRHPNIVTVHDSGIVDGNDYFVMDYVDGEELDQYVSKRKLTLHAMVELFRKICSAVTFAHQNGVIHRDLKSSNIRVDGKDEPYILDFGLAKRLEDSEPIQVSLDGQILGTPQYMSPEQARGSVKEIDARTDVYSLGVIFYKMLTGTFPYPVEGKITDVLSHIQRTEPQRPSKLVRPMDSDLEVIVLKSLAKEPNRRYQSVAELERDIEYWLAGMPIVARSVSSIYVLRKLMVRHRYAATILGLMAVSITGFSVFSFQMYRMAGAERTKAALMYDDLNASVQSRHGLLQQMAFKFFLEAWQKGRLTEARQVVAFLSKGSREARASRFLLDPKPTVEKGPDFQRLYAPSDPAFTEFILGEAYLKQGDKPQALEAFRSTNQHLQSQKGALSDADRWLALQVRLRLTGLESKSLSGRSMTKESSR